MFQLIINNLEGSAFQPNSIDGVEVDFPQTIPEVCRLLREVIARLEEGHDCGALFDHNGNRCGEWGFEA